MRSRLDLCYECRVLDATLYEAVCNRAAQPGIEMYMYTVACSGPWRPAPGAVRAPRCTVRATPVRVRRANRTRVPIHVLATVTVVHIMDRIHRFTHWNFFLAFFWPGFLRSTRRESTVSKPAGRRIGRKAASSILLIALAMPLRMAPA